MDRNTVIGLLLITAIIIGFTIYNRPSQEQIAEQQRLRDSVALSESQRPEIINEVEQKSDTSSGITAQIEQGDNISSFFSTGDTQVADSADSLTRVVVSAPAEEIIV